MAYKARTLDQILSELSPAYKPQIQTLQKRQALVPGMVQADIQEAEAKQSEAYENILGGARRRGLGFSGIPLGEQAKYASTVFAPEVLRARQRGQEAALSLEDAILGVRERQRTAAMDLRQQELNRQFQAEEAAKSRAAARAAAAAARPSFGSLLGSPTTSGGGGGSKDAEIKVKGANDQIIQQAYNNVRGFLGQDDDQIKSDYLATASSAQYGNVRDLAKLQIYRALRPDLFKFAYQWESAGGRQPSGGSGRTTLPTSGGINPLISAARR